MRPCPVCNNVYRIHIFSMGYKIPDGWPLPSCINWYKCEGCGMLYGDGDFNQETLNEYYVRFYGYGVNSPANTERLKMDALQIETIVDFDKDAVIVDFGGAGDDGHSVIVDELQKRGFVNAACVGPNDPLPDSVNVIYASHVLEHIYDMYAVMQRLEKSLAHDGLLIVDVPNSTGLLKRWKMPILDFNTKHINHFTLRDILNFGYYYGFEMMSVREYELEVAPAFQVQFKKLNMARASADHITQHINKRIEKLLTIEQPVNVWGMSDIVWHLLSLVDLEVLDYIDNDPAYRGQTYNGRAVLERPTNDAPIVVMAQGQRKRLIENIRKMGIENLIIEV